MFFMFLLTIYTLDTAIETHVVDHALTATDCIQMMTDYAAADPSYSRGTPSCEFDAHANRESAALDTY